MTTTEQRRAQWIAALRSGEYEQGKERLRDSLGEDDQYCCMGVLVDLFDEGGWQCSADGDYYPTGEDGDPDREAFPSLMMCDKVGLIRELSASPDGHIRPGVMQLASLNDHLGYTFEQIADDLEQHPERFFGDAVDTGSITC